MVEKTDAEVIDEIYESVKRSSRNKKKGLKSSTFWGLFDIKKKNPKRVETIRGLLDDRGLNAVTKSGTTLGKEKKEDWIILRPKGVEVIWPPPAWFEMIQNQKRKFSSEMEVMAFFVAPLIDELGYDFDDIEMDYPVEMHMGARIIKTKADVVLFNGSSRAKSQNNVLLVVEAKRSDQVLIPGAVEQARSYAHELMSACYVVSNGERILVFIHNGNLVLDDCVMDFDRSELEAKWAELYGHVSKQATLERKNVMGGQLKQSASPSEVLPGDPQS